MEQPGITRTIAVHNPPVGMKAIDVRRNMMRMPDVLANLTPTERLIFEASTKTPIGGMADADLLGRFRQLGESIARDAGYNTKANAAEWVYNCTRIVEILKRYYSQLTLADIKVAFECAVVGQLDEFLPKDSQGNPDRKHYQQFNAEYFAKILNAYKKLQNAVINKAHEAASQLSERPLLEGPRPVQYPFEQMRESFLRYKYTGALVFGLGVELSCHEWLVRAGWCVDRPATAAERKEAYARYMQRVAAGFVNKYTAMFVRREGPDCSVLNYTAYEVMRRREIRTAFDRMIAAEVQIEQIA